MIGPSISILIDGYVEKQNGLISLRGTLVPAKTLNNLISKIPVVGDILIGKEVTVTRTLKEIKHSIRFWLRWTVSTV